MTGAKCGSGKRPPIERAQIGQNEVTGVMLCVLSSPYRRQGLLYSDLVGLLDDAARTLTAIVYLSALAILTKLGRAVRPYIFGSAGFLASLDLWNAARGARPKVTLSRACISLPVLNDT